MERRLGRGLGSLLGQGDADKGPQAEAPRDVARELPLRSIRPNPGQPRKTFNSEHLEELKRSIELHGVLQPILVRPAANGVFEIVSGERRWRAARLAGLESIPVVVRSVDDRTTLELAIVENVQRRDLDPIEKAKGFQQLVQQFGLTHQDVAERVGLERSTVANFIRLLDLPHEVQEGVTVGLITPGHARALLGTDDVFHVKQLFERVVRDELSVRETEKLVKTVEGAQEALAALAEPQPPQPAPPAPGARGREAWVGTIESRMREHLGAKVELQKGKGFRGRIVVHFNGREDLERLADLLGPKDLL